MGFESLAKKRASIKRYSDKKVKIETVMKLIETANLAPSPGNLPIVRYLIVENKDSIKRIAEACMQDFIEEANLLIIICSDSNQTKIMYDKRAKTYVKQHVGAAIENLLLHITELGLASCWVGAFSDTIIKTMLKIPDDIEIEAILPLAYPSKIDKTTQKKKPSLGSRVFFEIYNNKFYKPFPKIRD